MQILQELNDEIKTVFIIAHNPEITLACEWLTDVIIGNIPTCGIVGIRCECKSFKELGEGSGKMLFFDYPKKHQ